MTVVIRSVLGFLAALVYVTTSKLSKLAVDGAEMEHILLVLVSLLRTNTRVSVHATRKRKTP